MAPDSEPRPRVPWVPVNEVTRTPVPPAQEQEAAPADAATAEAAASVEPSVHAEPSAAAEPTVPEWIRPQPPEDAAAAVDPPAADEVLPRPGATPVSEPVSPYDTPAPALWNADPVQRLGATAVTSAALSASGAPTPLGGVPTVAPPDGIEPPDFGESAPLFTPRFEGEPEPTNKEKADALAKGIVAEETARLALSGAALEAGGEYTPLAFGNEDAAAGAHAGTAPEAPLAVRTAASQPTLAPGQPAEPPPASGDDGEPPKRKRWWVWALLVLAVLVVAGIGVTVWALNRNVEPAVVPGVTVTLSPPAPTITPTPVPSGSAFQSSMPATVDTFSLVSATVLDPQDVALNAGRIADGVDLVYRSGDDTMAVRALQYYNEDDATTMFTQFAGEPAVTEPVMAGDTQVGESATVLEPLPGIVWRNGTSVFILTGTADQVAGFFEQFGL